MDAPPYSLEVYKDPRRAFRHLIVRLRKFSLRSTSSIDVGGLHQLVRSRNKRHVFSGMVR